MVITVYPLSVRISYGEKLANYSLGQILYCPELRIVFNFEVFGKSEEDDFVTHEFI